MSEMIERVARAIAGRKGTPWEERMPSVRAEYMADARVAIEAMREPTAAMAEAGLQANVNAFPDDAEEEAEVWRAMIDAALRVSDEHPKGRDPGLWAEPASAASAAAPVPSLLEGERG